MSKRHKNNHAGVKSGTWSIYYYNEDGKMQTKRINPLLIWYYKLRKRRRVKGVCPKCNREFLCLTNWHDKKLECPFCLDDYDDYEN